MGALHVNPWMLLGGDLEGTLPNPKVRGISPSIVLALSNIPPLPYANQAASFLTLDLAPLTPMSRRLWLDQSVFRLLDGGPGQFYFVGLQPAGGDLAGNYPDPKVIAENRNLVQASQSYQPHPIRPDRILAGANITVTQQLGAVSIAGLAGTVTSVGLSLPTEFKITGSPVTTAGTLTGEWNLQAANTFFAGPTSGVPAIPNFRAMVAADLVAHNLLSASHGDTTAAAVVRGDVVTGQGVSPKWQRLALGVAARLLRSDGTDAAWAQAVLTTDVTGILPIANGGTNSSTALANNQVMKSSAGAIVEAGAMTNGQVLIGSTSAAPVVAALTAGTNIAVTNGAGSITVGVTGTIAVANGGTNSATALNNNRQMVSSGGAVVESAAATNGQLLIGSTGAAPVVAALTQGSGITITNGAGSITIAGTAATVLGARVFNSAAISTANATTTTLTFDSERWDTDTIHSTTVNTSRLTATTAGKYVISATIEFANSAGGSIRLILFLLNGVTQIAKHRHGSAPADADLTLQTIYDLAATDYVEVQVYQDSGGALNVVASGNISPEFMMARIGP